MRIAWWPRGSGCDVQPSQDRDRLSAMGACENVALAWSVQSGDDQHTNPSATRSGRRSTHADLRPRFVGTGHGADAVPVISALSPMTGALPGRRDVMTRFQVTVHTADRDGA